jgi:hypothetical protein
MLPQEICKLGVRSAIDVIIFCDASLFSEVESYVTHGRGDKR